MASLRGKVVLIDFWTYSCINCIRTQPYLKALYAKYTTRGSRRRTHSRVPVREGCGNVKDAVESAGLDYPVVQDNDYTVWDSPTRPVLAG